MQLNSQYSLLFAYALLLSQPTWADDSPQQSCNNAAKLYKDGDLEGALEEARWCVTLMEQEKQSTTNMFFKDEIDGFKGGQLEHQNVMGFQVVSREYQKDGKYIEVSLNSGSNGSAMQAFAAIAQLGQGTGKKVRVQKRSAVINSDNGEVSLNITMRSGGILTFTTSELDANTLLSFAKKFPVKELDESRD